MSRQRKQSGDSRSGGGLAWGDMLDALWMRLDFGWARMAGGVRVTVFEGSPFRVAHDTIVRHKLKGKRMSHALKEGGVNREEKKLTMG